MSTTLTTLATVDEAGHLRLDLDTTLAPGAVMVVLQIESLPATGEKKRDLSDLVGKLKWQGDAVAEQRRMRDEW